MIGTWIGAGGVASVPDNKVADIFHWDRVSDSFTLPLKVLENGVHSMLSYNNLLYFQAGIEGKLFVTDGSSIQELGRPPQHVVDITSVVGDWPAPGGMAYMDGKIIMGPMPIENNYLFWL